MGYLDALSRVQAIDSMAGSIQPAPAAAAAPAATSFSTRLTSASVLSAASGQVGQTEQPPGSNDGPAIATYRSAVAGAYPGAPWCAYFVSWCARQAGTPIGPGGEGLGSVAEITDWARSTGRLTDTPAPGELILFGDRHVGLVESVDPDGTVHTIEGNTSDGVRRETHAPGEATGYVRLG